MADTEHGITPWAEEFASGLRAKRDQEVAEAETMAQRLATKRDGIRRLDDAIKALMRTPNTPKKSSPKSGVRLSTRTAIQSAVERAGAEGTTLTRLIAETGLSTDTIRRGLNVLRSEHIVRRAGVNARREAVYKMMPELIAASNNGS
jgi:response regulator of citrate/malate metabolism